VTRNQIACAVKLRPAALFFLVRDELQNIVARLEIKAVDRRGAARIAER
jgi:hypothetical protein